MGIGNYLLETPGSDLDLNVLREIESTLQRAARSTLPLGLSTDEIDDLYNNISVVAMMLKRWDIDNLPKKAMQTGRAFINATHFLTIIVPIVICNSDLL